MTAIAGFWSLDGRPVDRQCSRILQGQAVYGSHQAQSDDGTIALGRNLYAILPEDRYDRAPFVRGEFRLVADVRLDNRADLVSKVGTPATMQSDAELLFEALLKWGEQATDHLVGEYAFALWDGRRRELLLGRDILGLRPLHYHCGQGFFAFASMPSGLHALPEVPYALDKEFLVQALALAPPAGGQSHFSRIMRVEPGHLAKVTSSGVRQRRHWSPAPMAASRDAREAHEELRELFDTVVEAQLRGPGIVVATHLSSGLDSAAVTATVARQHSGKVTAFTAIPRLGFEGRPPPGTTADEGMLAAATARAFSNVEHILVESNGISPTACLERSHAYQQQPIASVANTSWGDTIHGLARARGAKIIFKGGLGNLTASYSGVEALPWYLSQGRVWEAFSLARGLSSNGITLSSLATIAARPFFPATVWRALRKVTGRAAGLRSYSAVNRGRMAEIAQINQFEAIANAERPSSDHLHDRITALTSGDGGGNAYKGVLAQWGLSVREPMADRRIIEFCLGLPIEEFVRDGVPRSLARRAFADRLPAAVVHNRLRGAQASDWYEAFEKGRPEIEREIETFLRCADAREVLDPSWFEEALKMWPTGDWNNSVNYRRYRIGLLRGIAAGHFMRKVAGTN